MEQIVQVKACYADGTAQVLHVRQSACSGDCHKCSGCGAAKETMLLTVQNPIGAQPGELVTIRSETGPVLRAAAVLYLIPVALFFLGYLLGELLLEAGALTGCLAFAAGLGLAIVYDRRVVKHQETVYTITGYPGGVSGAWGKGENDLD